MSCFGSVLKLTLFNVFIYSLEYRTKCNIDVSMNKAKLEGVVSVMDIKVVIPRHTSKKARGKAQERPCEI